MKIGFTPISIEKYVEIHLRANPGAKRAEITQALKASLADYKNGVTCQSCGNPIWVIGSALAGPMCFTCITGEAIPEDEYEIDEACY
ncbi:MAG TPA: hypothetical protein VMS73_00225 [Anaerolineaceae bacterium]|nr:hypothetical protein [Anaerolineaceae bacterium]